MIYSIVRKLGGFALVSAATLTLHDLSLRQTPEDNPIPIPPECGDTFQCSSDWLSQALGFTVNSSTQKSIGGGFTTSSYRLNLNPADPDKPRSVVVKYYSEASANHWKLRLFMWAVGGIEKFARKEIFFYRNLRSKLEEIGIKTPKPYYLGIQDYGSRSPLLYILGWKTWFKSVMIFEDLGQYQIFGLGNSFPEEHAEFAAKNLAKLHSSYWDNPLPLQLTGQDNDWSPHVYNAFFGLQKSFLSSTPSKDTITERMNNWQEVIPIFRDQELRSNLASFTEYYHNNLSSYQNPQINKGPLFSHSALLHGDYHAGNMFFVNDPETKKITDAILIDWQCYGFGHPSTEFAYFLTQVQPDPARDQRLMKVYYDELTKKVSQESYPWEVFVREVELRSMGLVMWNMNFFRETPEQSKKLKDQIAKEGVEQTLMVENSAATNFGRFKYTFQKWQQEKIFDDVEKNLKKEKIFSDPDVPSVPLNVSSGNLSVY